MVLTMGAMLQVDLRNIRKSFFFFFGFHDATHSLLNHKLVSVFIFNFY